MNKTSLIAFGFLLFTSTLASAQSFLQDAPKSKHELRREKNSCRPYYIGLSTGINNLGGLLGFDFEYSLNNITTAGAHIGVGTWGIKTGIDARYYRKECHTGWAYGLGISYAGGNRERTWPLETISGPKNVLLQLHPQAGVQLEIRRFFSIGKHGHRLWTELGWNQRFTRKVYTVLDGQTLSLLADRSINLLCPGGLVIAAGYSMGIGGNKRKQ
jgi:hypothetical protein